MLGLEQRTAEHKKLETLITAFTVLVFSRRCEGRSLDCEALYREAADSRFHCKSLSTMSGAAATSVAQAAAPYWRNAGMTYLSYANTCAAMVRNCLKEPFKTKALQREHAYYKLQPFADGTAQKAVVRETGAPPSS